jgi:hypothetical protein
MEPPIHDSQNAQRQSAGEKMGKLKVQSTLEIKISKENRQAIGNIVMKKTVTINETPALRWTALSANKTAAGNRGSAVA